MADLRSSSLLPPEEEGESDPMSGLGNLMDVMLVFACGLILALVAHYNVDLSEDATSTDMQELEGELEYTEEGATGSLDEYLELGVVYQDVETGDLYVVEPEEDDDAESGESDE